MSLDLFIVPARAAEVSLDGLPFDGFDGPPVLRPGTVLQARGGDARVLIEWVVQLGEDRATLEHDLGRSLPAGTIDLAYRHADWAALFQLVTRLAAATRGAVYIDGALPWTADELGNPEDLALGLTGTGVPYDRWPALAEKLLEAIEAKSGA